MTLRLVFRFWLTVITVNMSTCRLQKPKLHIFMCCKGKNFATKDYFYLLQKLKCATKYHLSCYKSCHNVNGMRCTFWFINTCSDMVTSSNCTKRLMLLHATPLLQNAKSAPTKLAPQCCVQHRHT